MEISSVIHDTRHFTSIPPIGILNHKLGSSLMENIQAKLKIKTTREGDRFIQVTVNIIPMEIPLRLNYARRKENNKARKLKH